jgi:hypothetical protein
VLLGDKAIIRLNSVIEDFVLQKRRHIFLFAFLFYATR